jgi:hypothetical protein
MGLKDCIGCAQETRLLCAEAGLWVLGGRVLGGDYLVDSADNYDNKVAAQLAMEMEQRAEAFFKTAQKLRQLALLGPYLSEESNFSLATLGEVFIGLPQLAKAVTLVCQPNIDMADGWGVSSTTNQ